ncbi:M16 family metallopeptidase [Mariniblastus fucicola]|uniref:Peptidase M16 inactive domain protein n=1 Tax=Mariniblastus fucicola TaxID=980251 RepID=A0A5B9P805_9BACT|nr:pitrilysin family protein [Mariniblastus fucicola]QEG20746.1 Peptidase M16 inactive domain protein [Mariniblastus fucicola]
MQSEQILNHQYDNGLTLVAQPMPWLASAAFSILLPAGGRYDQAGKHGLANFTCEMVQRGCGELDSRQFIEQLQLLGVDYTSSASNYHTRFGGAMKATELHDTLSVYRDVLRKPHLPESQLEDGRQVCFQEIWATEDDLSRRAIRKLRERFFGDPDGRHADGTIESITGIGQQDIEDFWKRYYQPAGTIIAVAGGIDFEALKAHVGQLFDDWQPNPVEPIESSGEVHGPFHIPFESEQTQIALAWPGVAYSHPDFYKHRAAIGVLSDGMSSRLFHEVREKRGLCYSVFASAVSVGDRGAVIAHSGTSAARAQETLDVLVQELSKISEGVREDELSRLKVQFRSGMIMQQESCRSRAGSIASDWDRLGRVRTLKEITDIITGLDVESINEHVASCPPQNFDLVTLGNAPLEMKNGIPTTSA